MEGASTMENVTEALTSVSTVVTKDINPGTIATVIGLVLGVGITLYLTWFGIRKVISMAKNALRGRLRV